MPDARLVLDCRNELGEGPVWSARRQRLFWTDIHGRRLWSYDPAARQDRAVEAPHRIGCFAFRADGTLAVAFDRWFAFWDPETGAIETLHPFEPATPTTRLNDGCCDSRGRLIAGGMDEGSPRRKIAAVWRLNPDRTLDRLIPDVGIANSLCFSPDGRTLYFADTPDRKIWAYEYEAETGRLGARRLFHALPAGPGKPDGSTVDSEGFLWNAEWGAGRVVRYAPDGTVDRIVTVPASQTTCPAFGGPDLSTLYVTTARGGLDAAALAREPHAGGLFAVEAGVRGLTEPDFAG